MQRVALPEIERAGAVQADVQRQAALAQTQRPEKFFQQDFAWMNRMPALLY
jgi:hypothetical protein